VDLPFSEASQLHQPPKQHRQISLLTVIHIVSPLYRQSPHFDFNSVRPTSIASTYEDYAFDDRPMDEKPDEDEFE
jgi:hypothetical protein